MSDTFMDVGVLACAILFFFTVRRYINRTLRKAFVIAITLVLLVSLYGFASNISRIYLENMVDEEIAFFQSFMNEGSQTWLEKHGEDWRDK